MSTRIPSALLRSLEKLDRFDPAGFAAAHDSDDQVVSVHMNPEKLLMKDGKWLKEILQPPFEISGAVPWAADAYYLTARPSFTLDPFFHAGNYYVQEASGMFLAHALKKIIDPSQKYRVLDLCAAPGGKSTLIQSLISESSLLVSNEVIKTRVPVLCQNMTKWGRANSIVTNNDPSHFEALPGFFDVLIIDAPCSGSGLFRKDREAATHWSEDLVKLCSQRQQRILADAWDCLKEDGYLIYSTCSYSREENEDILDAIFRQNDCISIPLSPDPSWNIVESTSDQARASGYRFYPDKVSGEGFFISVIQKKQAVSLLRNKAGRNSFRLPGTVEQQIRAWIQERNFSYMPVGDSFHAIPTELVPEFEILKNALYLKKAGIRMGKEGEKDWIPDHELALANILKYEGAGLPVEKGDALRYLRGDPFETSGNGKGWRIVSFQNQPLGWVKLLGQRMNNYYPKSWRIRQ